MSSHSPAQRIAYWDNVKAVLIFLVVFGHFLYPIASEVNVCALTVFNWIYFFHMPAFVFTSGFFAKSYVERGSMDTNKLIGFLFLYVCFILAIWIIKVVITHSLRLPDFFSTDGAPWYLICMFFWYLAIPHFARIRPAYALSFTVLLALIIGVYIPDGLFLSLSRCFVFLPFFLAGYYMPGNWIGRIRPRMILPSCLVLLSVFFLCVFGRDALKPYFSLILGCWSYESISLTGPAGIAGRFIWYCLASVTACAFFCLIPKRNMFFTYIGQRTLAIYILHRLIREVFSKTGMYRFFGSGVSAVVICFLISAATTLVCSGRKTSALFDRMLSIPWTGNTPQK